MTNYMSRAIAGTTLALTSVLMLWSSAVSAGVSEWIPFEVGNGHIRVPVTLNGEATWAILDSGARGNAISERFLSENKGSYKYGRQIIVEGVHGRRKVNLIDEVDVGIFGANFRMGQLMPVRSRNFDFIVGLPFFENYILQIDYPNQQLRVINHESFDLKPHANVKMKRIGGRGAPVVRPRLNDEFSPWLLLDTGATTGVYLKRGDAERFGWLERFPTSNALAAGVNKVIAVEELNLPMMTIGPFTLENVIVMVQGEGEKTNVGSGLPTRTGSRLKQTDSDGILGYDVLRHFVVTMDFKRSLLHLAPPAE